MAWVAILVFGWAIQPIDDNVPVELDPDSVLAAELARDPSLTPVDAPRSQLVVCNSLIENPPRDSAVALPALPDDYVYARTPCDAPHAGARLAAVANALAVIAMAAGWLWITRRFELDDQSDSVTHETIDV